MDKSTQKALKINTYINYNDDNNKLKEKYSKIKDEFKLTLEQKNRAVEIDIFVESIQNENLSKEQTIEALDNILNSQETQHTEFKILKSMIMSETLGMDEIKSLTSEGIYDMSAALVTFDPQEYMVSLCIRAAEMINEDPLGVIGKGELDKDFIDYSNTSELTEDEKNEIIGNNVAYYFAGMKAEGRMDPLEFVEELNENIIAINKDPEIASDFLNYLTENNKEGEQVLSQDVMRHIELRAAKDIEKLEIKRAKTNKIGLS